MGWRTLTVFPLWSCPEGTHWSPTPAVLSAVCFSTAFGWILALMFCNVFHILWFVERHFSATKYLKTLTAQHTSSLRSPKVLAGYFVYLLKQLLWQTIKHDLGMFYQTVLQNMFFNPNRSIAKSQQYEQDALCL